MKKQITRISIHQTSKVIALVYAGASAFITSLMFISMFASKPEIVNQPDFNILRIISVIVFLPLAGGLFCYLFSLFACFLYNRIAKLIGGIEFTVSETDDP
ncbi:hypothetical protein [Methylomicrobium sp. Wu6]|uniref:hypothetical protein n=1 Tax=Methylomicrobium sp. Wu6 TaxID=3107928 RepID=UPI002DD6B28C|nr:hypothetical protein [Methylomicrobium sp. Wu6]MEC4749325.1 hypothetical protein [Methylomicrobium sp. Wu6]